MKRYTLKYPGDHPVPALEMNRKEFFETYPRSPIQIIDPDGVVDEISIPEDTLLCDLCNDDPGDWVLVVDDSRAYCRTCAEHLTPYLKPFLGEG